ncbi:MAG: hypothetical protein ABI221_01540 [Candidatus Saccharimonadales bacterium]
MAISRKFAEYVGWCGAVAIVSAYALVSFNAIPADGWAFQLLNLTGAVGIIVISILKGVPQSVVLNIFWAAIAIVALARLVIK